jgi:hypothetical protein
MAAEIKSGVVNMASFIEIEDENHKLTETSGLSDAMQMRTKHGKPTGR